MRRVIVLASLGSIGIALSGCGSMPSLDFFRPTPPTITAQLDSRPSGAEAVTSLGPGCRTPCTVTVPMAESFTVTFTLDKHVPQTIPVVVAQTSVPSPDGSDVVPGPFQVEPNPVFAQLELARPVRGRAPAKKQAPPRAPKANPAAPPSSSAFPPPPR